MGLIVENEPTAKRIEAVSKDEQIKRKAASIALLEQLLAESANDPTH
jgi:hypothetical protein